jgi:uncharacterized coiled-coil protein SlyX
VKLSEELRGLTVRSDIIKLAEAYEAEVEKRIAELENLVSDCHDVMATQKRRIAELEAGIARVVEEVRECARQLRSPEHPVGFRGYSDGCALGLERAAVLVERLLVSEKSGVSNG